VEEDLAALIERVSVHPSLKVPDIFWPLQVQVPKHARVVRLRE
jgi:hypothetical protein